MFINYKKKNKKIITWFNIYKVKYDFTCSIPRLIRIWFYFVLSSFILNYTGWTVSQQFWMENVFVKWIKLIIVIGIVINSLFWVLTLFNNIQKYLFNYLFWIKEFSIFGLVYEFTALLNIYLGLPEIESSLILKQFLFTFIGIFHILTFISILFFKVAGYRFKIYMKKK